MKKHLMANCFMAFMFVLGAALFCPLTSRADGKAMPLIGAAQSSSGYARVEWSSDYPGYSGDPEEDVMTDVYAIYRKEGSGAFKLIDFVERKKGARQYYEDKTSKRGVRYTYSVAGFGSGMTGCYDSDDIEECIGSGSFERDGNDSGTIWVTQTWGKLDEIVPIRYLIFVEGHLVSHFKTNQRKIKFYISGWNKNSTPDVEIYGISNNAVKNYDKKGVSITLPPLKKATVKKVKVVATNKARIDWTASPSADGYVVCRRTGKKWSTVATVTGDGQTYCYDAKVKKNKTYYYTVKAYQTVNKARKYAPWDQKGKKVKLKKTTVNPKKGDFSAGTVYGPKLSAAQRRQVKKAVKKFYNTYITSDMNAVEKLVVAQAYMSYSCHYAKTWKKHGANTAWGSLVYKNKRGYHEAQCSGYARGFKALCDAIKVPCRYVHANKKSANPDHQWCMVKVKGKWYIIDPQGNSLEYVLAFFLKGKKEYTGQTGMAWNTGSYPAVSKKSYSSQKINAAANDYKVLQAVKKINKKFK